MSLSCSVTVAATTANSVLVVETADSFLARLTHDGKDLVPNDSWLKEDVDAGMTSNYEPKVLHHMRPEYQAFPLAVFRDHVYQEQRSRRE
jgi:hypothetical protein